MMLGYLLARAGVEVLVLEKHADFLRDFRGDTIHPSTLEVMSELGLLEKFLKLPHQKVHELAAQVGETRVTIADFRHLPTHCGFIAMMPQWDFLNFLAEQAGQFPNFALRMETEVTGLVQESGRVMGVHANTPQGMVEVGADLVVGADGRTSIVRELAGLKVKDLGAPMDVLWFRLGRSPGDPVATMGRFDAGRIFIMINRGEYWQCGYVIAKAEFQFCHGFAFIADSAFGSIAHGYLANVIPDPAIKGEFVTVGSAPVRKRTAADAGDTNSPLTPAGEGLNN
jgi:2-polyprenyl-6-methoxyphenol hydroxylase-like FAD-dependent oxidoreductase